MRTQTPAQPEASDKTTNAASAPPATFNAGAKWLRACAGHETPRPEQVRALEVLIFPLAS